MNLIGALRRWIGLDSPMGQIGAGIVYGFLIVFLATPAAILLFAWASFLMRFFGLLP